MKRLKLLGLGVLLALVLVGCDLTSTPPVSPTAPLSTVTVTAAPTATDTPTPVPSPPPPTPSAPALQVVSVDMTVAPAILSNYQCGSQTIVTYTATLRLNEGNAGGVISFRYTTDNGRGEVPVQITVGPGQTTVVYSFYWSGKLPSDHTHPGLGGIVVTSPDVVYGPTVQPAGVCYQ